MFERDLIARRGQGPPGLTAPWRKTPFRPVGATISGAAAGRPRICVSIERWGNVHQGARREAPAGEGAARSCISGKAVLDPPSRYSNAKRGRRRCAMARRYSTATAHSRSWPV